MSLSDSRGPMSVTNVLRRGSEHVDQSGDLLVGDERQAGVLR